MYKSLRTGCWNIKIVHQLFCQFKISVDCSGLKLLPPFTAQDAAHSLTVLRSKNAPIIKKRQVMRSSFGDYRTKMLEEEKKFNKGTVQVA